MNKETPQLAILSLVLSLACTWFLSASPKEITGPTADTAFFSEFRLGSQFDVAGAPQSLQGGYSAIFLFTEPPRTGKSAVQSSLLAFYAEGGYSWIPASFYARAGFEFGDPRAGSINLGAIVKKTAANEAYRFFCQGGMTMKFLETTLDRVLLSVNISVNYTAPGDSGYQTSETLLDCVQAGIIFGCRLPGASRLVGASRLPGASR